MPTVCPPIALAGDPAGTYCFKCESEMLYEEHQHPRVIDDSIIFMKCPKCGNEIEGLTSFWDWV